MRQQFERQGIAKRLKEKIWSFASSQGATHVVVLDGVFGPKGAAASWWVGEKGGGLWPTSVVVSTDQLVGELALPNGFLQPWEMATSSRERPQNVLLFASPTAPVSAQAYASGGHGAGQTDRGAAAGASSGTPRKRPLASSSAASSHAGKRAAGTTPEQARGTAAAAGAQPAVTTREEPPRTRKDIEAELLATKKEAEQTETTLSRLQAKDTRLKAKIGRLQDELRGTE